jgi:hypothetical protein
MLFESVGCSVCHVESITTAPAGTAVNGGMFVVPDALGNKMIHPFGDSYCTTSVQVTELCRPDLRIPRTNCGPRRYGASE